MIGKKILKYFVSIMILSSVVYLVGYRFTPFPAFGIFTIGEWEPSPFNFAMNYSSEHSTLEKKGHLGQKLERNKPITKSELLDTWGKPDVLEVGLQPSTEIFKYEREIGYSGIVLGLGVPIPLVIPFGSRYTVLQLEDDVVTSIRVIRTGINGGAGCTLGATGHGYQWVCI